MRQATAACRIVAWTDEYWEVITCLLGDSVGNLAIQQRSGQIKQINTMNLNVALGEAMSIGLSTRETELW